ncbi:hypothetical protein RU639_009102 [Aspergillus parasiticus]
MVVDKKWEVVRIAMLCDAPKKKRSPSRRSETPRADFESDAAEAFQRSWQRRPRDQVFKVIGRRRLIGFGWMESDLLWSMQFQRSFLTIETKVSLMSSKAMIGSVRLTQGWPKGGGRPPCGVSACTTCS